MIATLRDTGNFRVQNSVGEEAEARVIKWLRRHGFAVMVNAEGREARQDLWVMATAEVKHDTKAASTGNVFIEVLCRGKPSGLATTCSHIWIFDVGDGELVLIPTSKLKELASQGERRVSADGNAGRLIPLATLRAASMALADNERDNDNDDTF